MKMSYPHSQTQDDFENISFHDNRLWGIDFLVDYETLTCDLKLDIDHICEWVETEEKCSFKWMVAPADLIFHGVTGLKLGIDWKDEKYQASVAGPYILGIERRPVEKQYVHFDRINYVWEFKFHDESHLSLGA